MMRTTYILLAFLGLTSSVLGQSVSRKVVSSAGGTLTGGSNQITYTIGETVIPSVASGSNAITQGFEQPGEQVTTANIASGICPGSSVTIQFTAIDIGGGNTFTAQLSNSSGSFTSPVNIGTTAGNASGTIAGTIPLLTGSGTGYRIRVVANSPSTSGLGNVISLSDPIVISTVKTDAFLGGNTGSAGMTFIPAASTILWSSGETTNYISKKMAGTYTGTVTSPAGCTLTKIITIN